MHALPNPWFQFESAWEGLIYNTCIYKNEESHTAKLLDHTNLMWIASVAHALTPIIVLITQLITDTISISSGVARIISLVGHRVSGEQLP